MKIITLLLLLLVTQSCTSTQVPISEVRILNHHFIETNRINDTKEINDFSSYWKGKVKSVQHTKPSFNYKIDIIKKGRAKRRSTRWLYDSKSGLCTILTVKSAHTYFIADYQKFNKSLNL